METRLFQPGFSVSKSTGQPKLILSFLIRLEPDADAFCAGELAVQDCLGDNHLASTGLFALKTEDLSLGAASPSQNRRRKRDTVCTFTNRRWHEIRQVAAIAADSLGDMIRVGPQIDRRLGLIGFLFFRNMRKFFRNMRKRFVEQ